MYDRSFGFALDGATTRLDREEVDELDIYLRVSDSNTEAGTNNTIGKKIASFLS